LPVVAMQRLDDVRIAAADARERPRLVFAVVEFALFMRAQCHAQLLRDPCAEFLRRM